MELMRALYHWLRLGYYTIALDHIHVDHPDAPLITMRCIESQRVMQQFLYPPTSNVVPLQQQVQNELRKNVHLADLLILALSTAVLLTAIVVLAWR